MSIKTLNESLCGLYRIKERGGNPHTFIKIELIENKFIGTTYFKSGSTFIEDFTEKEITKEVDSKNWTKTKNIIWSNNLGDE